MSVRVLGGVIGSLYRFGAWTFLRWIAGRHGVALPVLYLLSLVCLWINRSGVAIVSQKVEADQAQELPSPARDNSSHSSVVATNGSAKKKRKRLRTPQTDRPVLPEPDAKTAGLSLTALVTGAPSISRPVNIINILVNTALLAAVFDMLFVPYLAMEEQALSFTRVGHVDHQSAAILARFAQPANDSQSSPRARIAWRQTKPMSNKWVIGPELVSSEAHDWTAHAVLDGLWASTEYEYRLLTSDGSAHHPNFEKTHAFVTSPDPRLASATGSHFSFVSTSCIRPGFPYRGPSRKRETVGARFLREVASRLPSLRFAIFVGDFIYADVPFAPNFKQSTYLKRYRQTFASPEMKDLVEELPSYFIYDDHEIKNDFSFSSEHEAFGPAISAYETYLGATNPHPFVNESYYHFNHGDASFFVLDTRKHRSSNYAADDSSKTMLGPVQKANFLQWLHQVNGTATWKFVVSSVPFMSLWSHGSDTWASFTTERDELMNVLQYVPNVIILSGDRHEFAAASIRTTVTEFSTSPLNQFYLPIRTLSQRHGRGATGEDVLLKYLPDGNTKFTVFEVDDRIQNKPTVRVSVIIDGQEAWKVEVHGKPVRTPVATVGGLAKSLLELLGFKRRSWFT